MAAVGFSIPGNPGEFRKGDARIIYPDIGRLGRCKACGHPRGRSCIVQAELPSGLRNNLRDLAFAGGLGKLPGVVGLSAISYWPKKWGKKGRAPGRPMGDVDAPLSNLLDGLADILYRDDAQVGLVVLANALGTPETARIDVTAKPIPPGLLEDLRRHLSLPFDTARLTLGEQERLIP